MQLGTEVDLGPGYTGYIVLDRDPAPPTDMGTSAPTLFGRTFKLVVQGSWLLQNGHTKYGSQFTDAGRTACLRKPRPVCTLCGETVAHLSNC